MIIYFADKQMNIISVASSTTKQGLILANDDKVVVTHRIVEIVIDKNDATVRRFRTKGDANDVTDAGLVHYKNVLGTPIITIPLIGYIAFNILFF